MKSALLNGFPGGHYSSYLEERRVLAFLWLSVRTEGAMHAVVQARRMSVIQSQITGHWKTPDFCECLADAVYLAGTIRTNYLLVGLFS